MLTISCYTFHPIIHQFIRLWRRVQVVSDWVTCILAVLCCQCGQEMPLSTSTSACSQETVTKPPEIEAERANGEPLVPQHTIIDFTPTKKDTEETATRRIQFWEFVKSQHELEGIIVTPQPVTDTNNPVPIHKKPPSKDRLRNSHETTAVTTHNKIQNKGVLNDVFH